MTIEAGIETITQRVPTEPSPRAIFTGDYLRSQPELYAATTALATAVKPLASRRLLDYGDLCEGDVEAIAGVLREVPTDINVTTEVSERDKQRTQFNGIEQLGTLALTLGNVVTLASIAKVLRANFADQPGAEKLAQYYLGVHHDRTHTPAPIKVNRQLRRSARKRAIMGKAEAK